MQSKDELKKQVVILTLILIFVIGIAIVLNMNNKTKKELNTTIVTNNVTVEQNKNEDMKNLKGLIEENTEETGEQDKKTKESSIKNTINTGKSETITTNSNQQINYEEIWHGDN